MPELPVEIEIQRVMNLVRGFGWEKIKEEIEGNTVRLSIEKKLSEKDFTEGIGVPS